MLESYLRQVLSKQRLRSEIAVGIGNLGFRERMGGGHGGGITYKGVTVHTPKTWHTVTGKGLCAVMWFWILYRAKQDGPVVMGWRHPWDGHGDHGHGDHH